MRAHIKPLLLNVKALSKSMESLFRNVLQDTIDVEIDDGPGAFFGLKEGHVLAIVLIKSFDKDNQLSLEFLESEEGKKTIVALHVEGIIEYVQEYEARQMR